MVVKQIYSAKSVFCIHKIKKILHTFYKANMYAMIEMKSEARAWSISICFFRGDLLGKWDDKRTSYALILPALKVRE